MVIISDVHVNIGVGISVLFCLECEMVLLQTNRKWAIKNREPRSHLLVGKETVFVQGGHGS